MFMNKDRALGLMKEFGLKALIATKSENIVYATDMEMDTPNVLADAVYCAILPLEENLDPTLLVPTSWLAPVFDRPNRIKEVRSCGYFNYVFYPETQTTGPERKIQKTIQEHCYPDLNMVDLVVKTLKNKGLEKARIGLDERGISPEIRGQIIQALPQAEFVDALGLFRRIRMVKTKDEIEMLRKAATINEGAIRDLIGSLKERVSEIDLYREFEQHIIKNGAEKGHYNNGGGTRSAGLFPPGNYALKKGDLFRFDVGCQYHNYFADTGGVYIVGQDPNEKQRRVYKAMEAGLEKALSMFKPGVRPSRIFDSAMEAVKKSGIPDYKRHHLGHGIGIELYDSPLIRSAQDTSSVQLAGSSDVPLEENMTLNIEVPYYELGFGGMQIEYTLVITKNGFEFIIPYSRKFSRVG
jgi:Xaa-Pro aminopeptidase